MDNVVSNAAPIYRHYTDLYIVAASKHDQFIQKILTKYHRENITNRKMISRLLKTEHGITMRWARYSILCKFVCLHLSNSEATVARRGNNLGSYEAASWCTHCLIQLSAPASESPCLMLTSSTTTDYGACLITLVTLPDHYLNFVWITTWAYSSRIKWR